MKNKKTTIVLVVLFCAIIGFGVFFFTNKFIQGKQQTEINETVEEETPVETEEIYETPIETEGKEENTEEEPTKSSRDPSLEKSFINEEANIDYSKCLNTKLIYSKPEWDATTYSGIKATIGNDNKTVSLKLNGAMMLKFATNLGNHNAKVVGIKSNIKKMFRGGFGQSFSDERLFFLTEDGSIYYVKLFDTTDDVEFAFDKGTEQFTAKKLKTSLPGIVGFANTAANDKNSGTGPHASTVAVKADGSFYDLSKVK